MAKRKRRTMIVVTITAANVSYVERIPGSETRMHRDPGFYREIHFILDCRAALERYRDHFIYRYLEAMNTSGELPSSIYRARTLEITVKTEDRS